MLTNLKKHDKKKDLGTKRFFFPGYKIYKINNGNL